MSTAVSEKPKVTIESLKKRGRPARASELDSRDRPKQEPDRVPLPGLHEENKMPGRVIAVDKELNDEELKEEEFLNDPVTIRISKSSEKRAANCTELIAINGIWAEMLVNGKWLQVGYLPKGRAITVKRKYVEVMVRASVRTYHIETIEKQGEVEVQNMTEGINNYYIPVQMIEDRRQPQGREWWEKLLNTQV